MSDVLAAFTDARRAGVVLALDGDDKIVAKTKTPPVPAGLLALLRATKPDLLRILGQRRVAEAAFAAKRPIGASEKTWNAALGGLRAFLDQGWANQALLAGWGPNALFHVPEEWGHPTGAGLSLWRAYLVRGGRVEVDRWTVTDVDAEAISIELTRIVLTKREWGIEETPETCRQKLYRNDTLRQLVAVARPAPKVLSAAETALLDAITVYMTSAEDYPAYLIALPGARVMTRPGRAEVSALPERLLAVFGQAAATREEAVARFMDIESALLARGVEVRLDGHHVVLGLAWKGCAKRPDQGHLPRPSPAVAAAPAVDAEAAVARFKVAVEAAFGPGVEVGPIRDTRGETR
jgi:hypothetical protein